MTPRPDLRQFLSVFSAPVLLGLAPIFGKLALQAGADSFSTAALRTIVAVVALCWGMRSLRGGFSTSTRRVW